MIRWSKSNNLSRKYSRIFQFIISSDASKLILTFKTKTMTSSSSDEDAGIDKTYLYFILVNSAKLSALCDKTNRKGRDVKVL